VARAETFWTIDRLCRQLEHDDGNGRCMGKVEAVDEAGVDDRIEGPHLKWCSGRKRSTWEKVSKAILM